MMRRVRSAAANRERTCVDPHSLLHRIVIIIIVIIAIAIAIIIIIVLRNAKNVVFLFLRARERKRESKTAPGSARQSNSTTGGPQARYKYTARTLKEAGCCLRRRRRWWRRGSSFVLDIARPLLVCFACALRERAPKRRSASASLRCARRSGRTLSRSA
jgi:hypothetical protein